MKGRSASGTGARVISGDKRRGRLQRLPDRTAIQALAIQQALRKEVQRLLVLDQQTPGMRVLVTHQALHFAID